MANKSADQEPTERRGFCQAHMWVEKTIKTVCIRLDALEKELGGRVTMRLFLALCTALVLVLMTIGGMQWSIKDDMGQVKADVGIVKVHLEYQKADIAGLEKKIDNMNGKGQDENGG